MCHVQIDVCGVMVRRKQIGMLFFFFEGDWHAFVGCDVARESWFSSELFDVLLPRLSLFQSMSELIFYICRKESADMGGYVTVLLWQLWAVRNDVVWNSSRDTPLGIGRLALSN
jgi:hypothetical protein